MKKCGVITLYCRYEKMWCMRVRVHVCMCTWCYVFVLTNENSSVVYIRDVIIIHISFMMEFKCRKCGKVYQSKRSLNRHELENCMNIGKKYLCDICGNEFRHQRTLSQHTSVNCGQGVKRRTCIGCDIVFSQKSCLNRHMRLKRCKTELNDNKEANNALDTCIHLKDLKSFNKQFII